MTEDEVRKIVREEMGRTDGSQCVPEQWWLDAHWSQQNGPFCSACLCGGNWHYLGCEVGVRRGDTHFVSAEHQPTEPLWKTAGGRFPK